MGNKVGDIWKGQLGVKHFDPPIIKLYPSLVKNKLYISGIDKEYHITIFSMQGSLLFKGVIENNSDLNISFLSGLYLIKIMDKEKTITRKIVVN